MHNQIVFGDRDELDEEFDVIEFFTLDDETAALVDVKTTLDVMHAVKSNYENYTANEEFELLWEPDSISPEPEEWANVENVVSMHESEPSLGDGSGTTVVVMDSGIDTEHRVFSNIEVSERYDATSSSGKDELGHGTACAGEIATLAPGTELIDLRIFSDGGRTTMEIILRAYQWLLGNADRIDIVNMSWGSNSRIDAINRVHAKLISNNVRDVVAAGNSGSTSGSPATTEGAYSVGACTKYGEMADFSSYNPDSGNPDVTAIGANNVLARASNTSMGRGIGENWVVASGTSFAAPIGAALAAKYMSMEPTASIEEIKQVFEETATDIEGQPKDGAGILRYRAALRVDGGQHDTVSASVWSFAGRDTLYVNDDLLESGKYEVDPERFKEAFERTD